MGKIYQKFNVIDFISVALIIYCSNTVIFHQVYGKFTTPFFLIYSLFVFSLRKKTFSQHNIKTLLTFLTLIGLTIFANLFSFSFSFSNDTIIMFLFLFGTFFVAESMSFKRFKRYYIMIVLMMATYSLVVFLLYESGFLSSTYLVVHGTTYVMCMGENMGWYIDYHRIAGPFWEGGAYQIFLNIALLFKYDDLYDKVLKKRDIIQLGVLYLVIIFTKSTAGCIVLALITIICLPKVKMRYVNKKTKRAFFSIIVTAFVFALLSSDTVINKFNSNNLSFIRRSADLLSSLALIARYPFLGTGYYSDIASKNIGTNSLGLLEIVVYFGTFMLLFYCIQFFRTLKRYHFKINTIQLLLIIIVLNMTECVYTLPIMLLFLFKIGKNENHFKITEGKYENTN